MSEFNEKQSTFNLISNDGIIEMRGKFIHELVKEDFQRVGSINLTNYKLIDLQYLSDNFQNVIRLTIKGANHLENLNGIQYLQSLKELVIESTALTDWKLLNQLKQLDYLNIENCLKAKIVLDYIPKSVTGLILNANYTDLNGLSDLNTLTNLNISGIDSDIEFLPEFPGNVKKLNLRGFPKFSDGSCFKNLDSKTYLNNQLENTIDNLPNHLTDNKWFKHPSNR